MPENCIQLELITDLEFAPIEKSHKGKMQMSHNENGEHVVVFTSIVLALTAQVLPYVVWKKVSLWAT